MLHKVGFAETYHFGHNSCNSGPFLLKMGLKCARYYMRNRLQRVQICYDFKRLRQSSTVVGSKVQVLMSLEECKS